MKAPTRKSRPTAERADSLKDTRREPSLSDDTPLLVGELVPDTECAGNELEADDWHDLARLYSANVVEAARSGRLEVRRDRIDHFWYFRTPAMADTTADVEGPASASSDLGAKRTELAGELTTLRRLLDAEQPCIIACSPSGCTCPQAVA